MTFDTTAQTRIITGKVVDKDLNPVYQVVVQFADTTLTTKFDINGQFKISIPIDTKSLIIGNVGFEPASINLTDSCNQLDIVLLLSGTFDFISLKKVDKLRMREFKKLPHDIVEKHICFYTSTVINCG